MYRNHSGCFMKSKDKDGSKRKREKEIPVIQERQGVELVGSSGCDQKWADSGYILEGDSYVIELADWV